MLKSSKYVVVEFFFVSVRTFYHVRVVHICWLGTVRFTAVGTILYGFCCVRLDTDLN